MHVSFGSMTFLRRPCVESTSYSASSHARLHCTASLRARRCHSLEQHGRCNGTRLRQHRQQLRCSAQFDPRLGPTATDPEPWRQVSRIDAAPSRSSTGPGGPNGPLPPPPPPPSSGGTSGITKAFVAAAFIVGLGTGVYFDSEINLHPSNVASTELVDRRTPNSELCMAYGYSAMVFDQRLFVSFNPFNVYVTQPEVKPGCVLRRSNVNVLEKKNLVDNKEVDSCKRNMNTFAFVGDLDDNPSVSCVYHSEEAENQYLMNPRKMLEQGNNRGVSGASIKSGTDAASTAAR